MTMTNILFMDLKVLMNPDPDQVSFTYLWFSFPNKAMFQRQRFDGDFEHWGRCGENRVWPERVDELDDGSKNFFCVDQREF